MIEKVANNKYNTEKLNLNSIEEIIEKLDYFRTFFGKTHDLTEKEFQDLKLDIKTFFNLKTYSFTKNPPERLVRISNNNRILKAENKELSYLTDISQLLAPPIDFCGFGRCNIPNQQILYCATTEAGAYWETKPKNGDVITLSHFQLKPGAKVNTSIVKKQKTESPKISNELQEVYYLLEDFFIDVYSLEISSDRPRDYLFSSILASEMLFYPIVSNKNIEAILYPSVQKKKFGENLAIRNDILFEKYDLIGVETRFILDEYENLDHTSNEVTTDQVIGSFATTTFDFEKGKIIYDSQVDKTFGVLRIIQTSPSKQVRFEHEGIPKNITFNLTPKNLNPKKDYIKSKVRRNDKVNVVYQNGSRKDNVKYKTVETEIDEGKCRIVKY